MKKFVLVAALGGALGCALGAGAIAQTLPRPNTDLAPRDPPFGKGNASNDTMHQPSGSLTAQALGSSSHQMISPRDPPFGKGDASNDSMHLSASSPAHASTYRVIPPRDPPFGKAM